jgi:hypothetical protein
MLVVALGDLGDRYVELRGDEVNAFIDEAVTGFPDATPPSNGSPRPHSRQPRTPSDWPVRLTICERTLGS